MRIIAGEARGRRLKSVKGLDTRPTADRVKESLFAILTPYLPEANFLDLFAGTGSIGMEALSRGAAFCVFVETREVCVRVIHENLALCGFNERARVHRADVLNFLENAAEKSERYHLIYVDPPYDIGLAAKALELIAAGDLLTEHGWIIVEVRKNSPEQEAVVPGLTMKRQAVYGDTVLVFYQKEAQMQKGDSY